MLRSTGHTGERGQNLAPERPSPRLDHARPLSSSALLTERAGHTVVLFAY